MKSNEYKTHVEMLYVIFIVANPVYCRKFAGTLG